MLDNILIYIKNFNVDFTCKTQLDLIFERLCEKFAPDESNQINSIKFVLVDKFGYNPLERPEQIKKICEERDGQNKFREKIILRDKKCLVTGDNCEVCEAAHIIPYSISKSFDTSNGLLLNRCFHKMFDKYLWSVNSSGNIEFSNKIFYLDNFENYKKYNGLIINVSNCCKSNLLVHYNKFLELNSN